MISGRKVVIYNALHTHMLINSSIHKCYSNHDCYSILLSNCTIRHPVFFLKIFDNIIFDSGAYEVHKDNTLNPKTKIIEYYNKLLSDNNISLDSVDEIYVSCDVASDFSIYLNLMKKPHYFFEAYINQLEDARSSIYDWHINNSNPHGPPNYFLLAKELKALCGNSEYVIKKICFEESNESKLHNYVKFDFKQNKYHLSSEDKTNLIKSFYDEDLLNSLSKLKRFDVLLTQRQWKYPLSEDDTIKLYQRIVDCFFSSGNALVIKPHPSDTYDHHKICKKAIIIPPYAPADLIPLIEGIEIDTVLTISSTAIQTFDNRRHNIVKLGEEYLRAWKSIPKVLSCFQCVNILQMEKEACRFGFNYELYSVMKTYCKQLTIPSISWCSPLSFTKGMMLVDKLTDVEFKSDQYYRILSKLDHKSCIIFYGNLMKAYIDEGHSNLLKNIYPFEIICLNTENNLPANSSEIIYVYSKDISIVKILDRQVLFELVNTKEKYILNAVSEGVKDALLQ